MNSSNQYNQSKSEFQENLLSFTNNFVQRVPRYAVKFPGRSWNTKNKPLSDRPIISHLNYKYNVGTLSQWYPHFVILDIDNVPLHRVDHMRELLNLNSNNSMLMTSGSPDSYHLLFKPLYNNKPPTTKLIHTVFNFFALKYSIEIFPKTNKVICLPFGSSQYFIDESYYPLNREDWPKKLYYFNKLDDYDLNSVAFHQLTLDLNYEISRSDKTFNTYREGLFLYEHGLQMPSSRHESQYKVLYIFWRDNVPMNTAVDETWKWLKQKHNGFSKDFHRYPKLCKQEIIRQAEWIYTKYELSNKLPDSTHNLYHGFISKSDLIEIVNVSSANMPRMNFLYNLVRFVNPRRCKTFVGVHRDKLVSWSSWRTYLKYLNELEEKGILMRGTSYMPDLYSKPIILNWNFCSLSDAILYDGRSLNLLNNAIKLTFNASEFGQLLTNHRQDYSNIKNIIQNIYIERAII